MKYILNELSIKNLIKGAPSGLRRPLKMMKNAFYFMSKALFVLKIFKLLF